MEVGVELLRGSAATAFQEFAELIVEAGERPTAEGDEDKARKILDSLPLLIEPQTRVQFVDRALGGKLRALAEGLREWPESEQLPIIEALIGRWRQMDERGVFDLDLEDVTNWLAAHREAGKRDDRVGAVVDCVKLRPPANVRVRRRLPHAGSQKLVYEAVWQVGERTSAVALKQLRATARDALTRELLAHPLSLSHPNIVQTYSLQNNASPPEEFLVESWLRHPLDDTWRAAGVHEASRLLVEMTRALAFLHDLTLIHGDVKPDNIGIDGDRFVLLDFGIARPRTKFTAEVTPTGSLRTRAPELLTGAGIHAEKTDVWALGATVFNVVTGRFPLFRREGDEVPKAIGSHGEKARARFAAELKRRATKEWAELLAPVLNPEAAELEEARLFREHERFRRLLDKMLARDPEERPTASDVLHEALGTLPAFIGESGGRVFAPGDELRQLDSYLGDHRDLRLLPEHKRREFIDRLNDLEESLKAQRYRQALAAELVEHYENLAAADTLGKVEREEIERLFSDLRNFRGTLADREDDRLLAQVRARLDIKVAGEDEDYRAFLTTLERRVEEVAGRTGPAAYDDGAFVRRLTEFRQALHERP